jgi:anthranilate phosphoribosyltransferase
MDEITTTGPTRIAEIADGRITLREVTPEDFGLPRAAPEALRGGALADNVAALRRALEGEPGPFADLVALNAAASIHISGVAPSLLEGLEAARAAIASGKANATLAALAKASHA